MKGKLAAFAGILCIASLIVSGANAKGKPDKPGKTTTELIAFTGDLEGWAHVEGCCPNAGPFPEYAMYLPDGLLDLNGDPLPDYPAGTTFNGYLFMNGYGAGRDSKYIVQFWTDCTDKIFPDIEFETIGGVKVSDKKSKVLTVTFTNEAWYVIGHRDNPIGEVTFTLTRSSN